MTEHEIPAAEALDAAQSADAVLIDVREQHEWDRGHSPLARLLPMSAIDDRVGELPKDERLLIVCHSGQRSARVAAALDAAGYDAVSVAGGMIAVDAAGGEVVAEDGRTPSVH